MKLYFPQTSLELIHCACVSIQMFALPSLTHFLTITDQKEEGIWWVKTTHTHKPTALAFSISNTLLSSYRTQCTKGHIILHTTILIGN